MTSAFDFSGRTVLITGASRGLGEAIAVGFADVGAHVLLVSRSLAASEAVAASIHAKGRQATALALDVGDWRALDGFVETIWSDHGPLHVLVNNAGISQNPGSSLEMTEAEFDALLAVNLKGAFRLGALLGSRMAEADGGSIVNIASLAAVRPHADYAAYSASKAALLAVTTAHAMEFAPRVRVNAILPGAFETEMAANWTAENKARSAAWLKRNGRPSEIVATALYLAGDASSYTTGATIRVDGRTRLSGNPL